MGVGMRVLDVVEKYINKVCPFAAGCLILGSAYWTAVTYGAVTVMQVLGHKEGLGLMEQADPLFLFIGLPAIPLGLFVAKLLRWEEAVLRMWRKHSNKLPIFGSLYQGGDSWTTSSDVAEDRIPVSYTRVLVGAMVFPTISTLVGKLFFGSVKSNSQRSLLGGLSFFLMKGILRMYYMQMTYRRRSKRRIENYEEDEDN